MGSAHQRALRPRPQNSCSGACCSLSGGGSEVPEPTGLDPLRPMKGAERMWASRWRRSFHGRLRLPHTREHVGEAEMEAKAFRRRRPRAEAFAGASGVCQRSRSSKPDRFPVGKTEPAVDVALSSAPEKRSKFWPPFAAPMHGRRPRRWPASGSGATTSLPRTRQHQKRRSS